MRHSKQVRKDRIVKRLEGYLANLSEYADRQAKDGDVRTPKEWKARLEARIEDAKKGT